MVHQPRDPASLRELAVVVVLYDSADVIVECLASIPAGPEVIVVDNASGDDGAAVAQAARADARIIRSPRNGGFGAGCNLGWRATERPYVAFVNPDLRLAPGTLSALTARARSRPHSMVGPQLLNAGGEARPCKRRPTAWLDVCALLPAAARWAPAGWDGKRDPEEVVRAGGAVDSVEGACFVVARADLEAIGGFDEDFFLYYEEESLALALERLGGGAIYEAGVSAEHVGATSTDKVAGLALRHLFRSRVLFYRKREGDLRGRLIALAMMGAATLSLPGALVNVLRGSSRRGRPAYWGAVLRGLAAGALGPVHRRYELPAP